MNEYSERRDNVRKPLSSMALYWDHAARAFPPINAITTDPEDPPAFWDVPNPVPYAGSDVAAIQRSAYPDLTPLELSITPENGFEHALAVAADMGWELIAAEAEDGRIEATDTTLWYGFNDDVVVRVMPSNGGARIDVRSHSRLGRIDRAINARRIRGYLNALGKRAATTRK